VVEGLLIRLWSHRCTYRWWRWRIRSGRSTGSLGDSVPEGPEPPLFRRVALMSGSRTREGVGACVASAGWSSCSNADAPPVLTSGRGWSSCSDADAPPVLTPGRNPGADVGAGESAWRGVAVSPCAASCNSSPHVQFLPNFD
jgi:hypothetical protein